MKVQTEVRISDIDSSLIVPHRPITTEDQEEPSANQNVPHEGRSMLIGSSKRSARTILEPEIGENCWSRPTFWAFYNLRARPKVSLLQRRPRPSSENIDWGHRLRSSIEDRASRTCGPIRRVETCREASTNQEPAATPSSKKSAQAQQTAQAAARPEFKSDLDCQIKETLFWEKECVQKETEISSKTSC